MSSNRLINEKSPYLLQHAHNPVDWYPWGDEAFEKAKEENKPVFLSVGYATCHWCHVMERESFEDEEAARHLNDTFVCIKVDREERPDIDSVYMAALPDAHRPGRMAPDRAHDPREETLFRWHVHPQNLQVRKAWPDRHLRTSQKHLGKTTGKKFFRSAGEISEHLGKAFEFQWTGEKLSFDTLKTAPYEELESIFDEEHAGFGSAPKFPTPHRMLFLLRYYRRTGDEKALVMVRKTLKAMRLGGILGPHRLRVPPVCHGQALAPSPFRENALRSGPHGHGLPGDLPGDRRALLRQDRQRDLRLRAQRHDFRGRRFLRGRRRRQRGRGGQVLRLDRQRVQPGPGRGARKALAAFHEPEPQRQFRRRGHRQKHRRQHSPPDTLLRGMGRQIGNGGKRPDRPLGQNSGDVVSRQKGGGSTP